MSFRNVLYDFVLYKQNTLSYPHFLIDNLFTKNNKLNYNVL